MAIASAAPTLAGRRLPDRLLAVVVLVGLVLPGAGGWWWVDPLAGPVIVGYARREGATAQRS